MIKRNAKRSSAALVLLFLSVRSNSGTSGLVTCGTGGVCKSAGNRSVESINKALEYKLSLRGGQLKADSELKGCTLNFRIKLTTS